MTLRRAAAAVSRVTLCSVVDWETHDGERVKDSSWYFVHTQLVSPHEALGAPTLAAAHGNEKGGAKPRWGYKS